jgi:hypothetical protein
MGLTVDRGLIFTVVLAGCGARSSLDTGSDLDAGATTRLVALRALGTCGAAPKVDAGDQEAAGFRRDQASARSG